MENDSKKSFGEFITQRRRALGLTQREFADKLFVTNSAVSKWERGLSYPDITLIRDICEILGVSEHELLTASEDVEARSAEKLAARYRRLVRSYKLAQCLAYGGAALGCLIGDIAGGGLSWSLIVIAALLAAASLTLLPAFAPERRGGLWAAGGFTISLMLLYGAICLVEGGRWFLPAVCYTLLALGLTLLPYVLRRVTLPAALSTRKGLVYLAANTLLLFILLLEECLRTGGDWLAPAVLWISLALWLLAGAYVLRRLPLPCPLATRKSLLYTGISAVLLLALLLEECLRTGGDWFLPTALGSLLGISALLLPFVMGQLPLPAALGRHRALVWLAVVTALLLALVAACRPARLWAEAYPLTFIALALPWLLLGCLRYLPLSALRRAGTACAAAALWLWLAPWGVEQVVTLNGWVSSRPYELLRPYGADFSDWLSAPARCGYIMVTIMLALLLAGGVCWSLPFKKDAEKG